MDAGSVFSVGGSAANTPFGVLLMQDRGGHQHTVPAGATEVPASGYMH